MTYKIYTNNRLKSKYVLFGGFGDVEEGESSESVNSSPSVRPSCDDGADNKHRPSAKQKRAAFLDIVYLNS
jgi:hypothetical protein